MYNYRERFGFNFILYISVFGPHLLVHWSRFLGYHCRPVVSDDFVKARQRDFKDTDISENPNTSKGGFNEYLILFEFVTFVD